MSEIGEGVSKIQEDAQNSQELEPIQTPLVSETIVGNFPREKVQIAPNYQEGEEGDKILKKTHIPSDVQSKIDAIWKEKVEKNEEINRQIDRENESLPEEERKNHKELFNGPAVRIISAEKDPLEEVLHLDVEATDYKSFTGLKDTDVKKYIRQRVNDIDRLLADTIDDEAQRKWTRVQEEYRDLLDFAKLSTACGIVTTEDSKGSADKGENYLMLQKRSNSVQVFPEWLGAAGGTAEPTHTNSDGEFDPFETVLTEIDEETDITRQEISDIHSTGFFRNGGGGYGVMTFEATTSLSREEIEKRQAGKKYPEGTALFIKLTPEEIKRKLLPNLMGMVPDAAGIMIRMVRDHLDPEDYEYILNRFEKRLGYYYQENENDAEKESSTKNRVRKKHLKRVERLSHSE